MTSNPDPQKQPPWWEDGVMSESPSPEHFQIVSSPDDAERVTLTGDIPDDEPVALEHQEASEHVTGQTEVVPLSGTTNDDDDPYQDATYYDRPHITQFISSVLLQCVVWLASVVAGVWIAAHDHTATVTLNIILVILAISLVNLFFVKRSHIMWSGTLYIITKEFVTILRSDSMFFLIFREKENSIRKSTLVRQDRSNRTFTELFFFRRRGTAVLTTQDPKKPPIRITRIRDIEAFMRALKK